MVRLAAVPVEPASVSFDSQCKTVADLEQEYRRDLAPKIQNPGPGLSPEDYFRWAEELTKIRPSVQSLEHWEQIETRMIAPHVNQVLRALTQHLTGDLAERWQNWRDRYIPELLALLKELRRTAAAKSRDKTQALEHLLDPLLPPPRRKESLSRKALWVLASTPGVTCVLNGMRTPAYVEDSLGILRWESLPEVRKIYEAVKTLG